MKHISEIIDKILTEWAYRVHDGMPNPKNPQHIVELRNSLEELNIPNDISYKLIENLINEKKIWKTAGGNWRGERPDGTRQSFDDRNKTKQWVAGKDFEKDDKKEPKEKPKKKTKPKPPPSGVTSESIDSIDGDEKNKTMNGDEPPPGTESSAVAEIGVGYAMACLAKNNNDMASAEKCLEEKLSKTKLGAKHGTGSGKKAVEARLGMLQSAKRENQKVREINEQLGWENSETSHIGGSKSSLKATVQNLRDKGITHVNGIPIDKYEEIILSGGAGENPTDTMVCIVNEETGEVIMYHSSNKMSSKDQIANGSPAKEIREITNSADYNEEEQKAADKAGETRRKNIAKHRGDQKKYIQQQQDKQIEDSKDPEKARRVIDRLKGEKNSITTAADQQKYWKKLVGHPRVKNFMKEKGYDPKNLTPEQEIEVYQFYCQEMKNITDMDNPPESRRQGGVGDDDIQILTRTYGYADGKNQEETTTGEPAKDPVFDNNKMQSFYDLQTQEMNKLREDMNNIKPGSGDKAFGKRMAKRLHLDMAEGHNPGGIPNNRAETVMGVYGYKDLKQDEDGNMHQKKGKKFYKLDENGIMTDEEVDDKDLKDFDCAVVADKGTMSKCLGMEEGDKATDDLGITMGEYEGTKAIIYDRNGKQIGVQTARSKTGPGGAMQDSIAYHKDFQRCLAKETKLQGKCG